MSKWTAILPMKLSADRKSRLAPFLPLAKRRELSDKMAVHVIGQLRNVPAIDDVIMISPKPVPQWKVEHLTDQDRGLNAELDAAAIRVSTRLLVIHGDLPQVSADDIAELIGAAEFAGCAIAPDRHGTGTNALALTVLPQGFTFAFGPYSFARHSQTLGGDLAVVRRAGLACDIDTQADMDHASAMNFKL